ncbi:hypothetical protein ACP70R_006961 [Stipagrostis hirtigluma subsp. patula]
MEELSDAEVSVPLESVSPHVQQVPVPQVSATSNMVEVLVPQVRIDPDTEVVPQASIAPNTDEVLQASIAPNTKVAHKVSVACNTEDVLRPQAYVAPDTEEVSVPLESVSPHVQEVLVPQVSATSNMVEVLVPQVRIDPDNNVPTPLVSVAPDTKDVTVPPISIASDTKEALIQLSSDTKEVTVPQVCIAHDNEDVSLQLVSVASDTEETLMPRVSVDPDTNEVLVPPTSTAPNPNDTVDLVGSLTNSEPATSLDFPGSTRAIHNRHLSEDLSSLTINELRVNNGEQRSKEQAKGKGTSCDSHTRHFSEDLSSLTINDLFANKEDEDCHNGPEEKGMSRPNSAERHIFKAAEIAERFIKSIDNRVLIDHGAPIESVKDAVSKFGGILDWKERRKHVQNALDKVQEDVPEYQRRAEAAEVEKSKVLMELCSTRRIIEGLKLNMEKAQTEAIQAQQDSELADIRFKEIQHGIVCRESAAAKAEIELAKYRHASAVAELQSVKNELEQLQKEYASINTKRDNAEAKACESNAVWQEIEKTVEDLTLKIITLKELLTSSQAKHIIAEEQKLNIALAYQQEKANWQNELKEADAEVQKLSDAVSINKDLESKLESASLLLTNLQDEFSAYSEEIPPQVMNLAGEAENPMANTRLKLAKTKKELEHMKVDIEKAKDEVKGIWNVAATLRADLEREKKDLVALRHKEHLASISVSSLQEELSKITLELNIVHERTKEAGMPVELTQATEEVAQAKATARLAQHEVAKAREEADRAKAEVNVVQLRLEAVSREILAVNASQEIATSSANALQEYNQEAEVDLQADRRCDNSVTLSLEEYDMLTKKAQHAQDLSKKRVINAVEKIREAKEAEVRSLYKLEQLTKQIDERKSELISAQEKANSAQYGKLTMENELRKRRAKQEQQRKAGEPDFAYIPNFKNTSSSFDASSSTSNQRMVGPLLRADTIAATTVKEPKPRKSFFPKSIVTMFMSKKKTHLK